MGELTHEDCSWEEIREFDYSGEFTRFVAWIEGQLAAGHALELPAASPEDAWGLLIRRFKHVASGQVWILTEPEERSMGSFRIEDDPSKERYENHFIDDLPEAAPVDPFADSSPLSESVADALKRDLKRLSRKGHS